MKTKEFIRRVEELGYFINEYVEYCEIKDVNNNLIAVINKTTFLQLDTDYYLWDKLNEIDKKELFDLLIEYAKTPIEDREEEKKYYLRHKWLTSDNDFNYLNLYTNKNRYIIESNGNFNTFKTQFTQAEIDEIKERFNTNLEDFEIVEVEE